ncbi:UbiA family prenyltransferase [Chitinophaga sp. MM2321]|uniref:UbiA family prenyltransferase n=1 Tax=Chitinophaga sp. MM2321 TaxID=3137178 RepID=UPI0032D59FD3
MSTHRQTGLSFVFHEIHVLWKFINNDIWDTILPSLIAFFTAWIYCEHSWKGLPMHLLCSLVYACLYIYTFCMTNQVNSIEEDRINKPYRPLPTGLVTKKSTYYRIIIYNMLFLLLAYRLEIFWISVGWQLITYLLNVYGWSDHWITKNLFGMSIGTFLLLAAQWGIASPGEGVSLNIVWYFICISLWAGFALPIQDFRDEKGDREMGRKTLPIAIGDKNGRVLMVIHYLTLSPALFIAAMLTQMPFFEIIKTPVPLIILVIQLLVHWSIAIRLWRQRSPEKDNQTYHLFVYLFCAGVPVICYINIT